LASAFARQPSVAGAAILVSFDGQIGGLRNPERKRLIIIHFLA